MSKNDNKQIGKRNAKRKKKKKTKTGNNKNGARQWRGTDSPPLHCCGNSSFQNQGEYIPPLSNRPADKGSKGFWTFVRVPRDGPAEPMSKLVHQSACARIQRRRPLQWMRNAWKHAWLRDTFVYRYRCLGFADGGEDGSPFYYGLTVATREGRRGVWIWNGTDGKSKRVHAEG